MPEAMGKGIAFVPVIPFSLLSNSCPGIFLVISPEEPVRTGLVNRENISNSGAPGGRKSGRSGYSPCTSALHSFISRID